MSSMKRVNKVAPSKQLSFSKNDIKNINPQSSSQKRHSEQGDNEFFNILEQQLVKQKKKKIN